MAEQSRRDFLRGCATVVATPAVLATFGAAQTLTSIGKSVRPGGHLGGGKPYIIGERGPELFLPASMGITRG